MTISPQVRKYAIQAGVLVVLLGASFAVGRYTVPVKTIEHVVTQTVVQEHVVVQERVVTRTVYVKTVAKNVQTDTVVTKKADGTTVTETKTSDTTKVGISDQQASSTEVISNTQESTSTKTDSLKIVDASKPQWHLRVDAGAGARFVGPTVPTLVLGVGVERRIVGPFFMGLWAQTTLNLLSPQTPPYGVDGGLSLGAEF